VTGDDPYLYSGSVVLRNKLGISGADRLDIVERALVVQRAAEGIPAGVFDLTHLRAIHRRLEKANFLKGLSAAKFAKEAAIIMGDVNYVHPFREGNGRTQLFYLEKLAAHAGHSLDLSRIEPAGWITASRAAHGGDYKPMQR